jgi:hypothetical protein
MLIKKNISRIFKLDVQRLSVLAYAYTWYFEFSHEFAEYTMSLISKKFLMLIFCLQSLAKSAFAACKSHANPGAPREKNATHIPDLDVNTAITKTPPSSPPAIHFDRIEATSLPNSVILSCHLVVNVLTSMQLCPLDAPKLYVSCCNGHPKTSLTSFGAT